MGNCLSLFFGNQKNPAFSASFGLFNALELDLVGGILPSYKGAFKATIKLVAKLYLRGEQSNRGSTCTGHVPSARPL